MTTYVLHGHHNTLVSDYDNHREAMERLDYIRSGGKPATETPTRLRLIRILTDDEATDFLAARKAYSEAVASARKAYNEAVASARKAYDEAMAPARKAYDEAVASAGKAYDEAMAPAGKAYDEAVAVWHRSVCVPDCPWDGWTIFPGAAR